MHCVVIIVSQLFELTGCHARRMLLLLWGRGSDGDEDFTRHRVHALGLTKLLTREPCCGTGSQVSLLRGALDETLCA